MIFVTVGTHEQQFNRLIKEIDSLVEEKIINEEVFMQIGYSDYEPRNCKFKKLIPYDEMDKYMRESSIVITHGGPASFIQPIQYGKVPIVVPRLSCYNEHVNDHQLEFAEFIKNNLNNIVLVKDIKELKNEILELLSSESKDINKIESNNERFNESFLKIVNELVEN